MEEIAAGIELSVAKRCFVMAKKAGVVESVTLTGGCAKNEGLKQAIEKVLKVKVVELPIDPQLMGALGAAEYARQKGWQMIILKIIGIIAIVIAVLFILSFLYISLILI